MSLIYHCPLCQSLLSYQQNSFTCDNNHSFDMAKEGYINLLPVQNKKSKQPGDSLAMVQARRDFLAAGHYTFLQDSIADIIASLPCDTVIDLGCGEGFYTQAIKHKSNAEVYGVDISKSAIKYAAKRYKNCHFSVASISDTPFPTASADVLVSIFAPLFEQELFRLAKPGASLLVASPGPWHLKELKEIIYNTVNPHEAISAPKGFVQSKVELLERTIVLDVADVKNLIMMTPFAWKFRPEHWQKIEQQPQHTVTLSFYLSQFTKA